MFSWVHVAGELDLSAYQEISGAVRDALLLARVVVLDLRELTLIHSFGLHAILDARGNGGRVMLVRGPTCVDRILALAGVAKEVLIFDLDGKVDAAQPASALPDAA